MPGLSPLSRADWLSPDRVRRIAAIFALIGAAAIAGDAWLHTRHGLVDTDGVQLGRDFVNYWSGAHQAASGHAARVYDLRDFVAFERAHTAPNAQLKWYSYPPVAMLLSLPLAATGFVAGLILWSLAGIAVCAVLLERILGRRLGWSDIWLAAFATPAALMNILSGQNGAFTAALLTGGVLALERKPLLAGALLGMLCFKPHLAVLVPVALLAGGYGRTFLAAAISVLVLCSAPALLWGPQVWTGFLHNAPINVEVLEKGVGFWPRMPTAFAMVRLAGGEPRTAYAAQMVSAVIAAVLTFQVWRSQASLRLKGAALTLATFLASPYVWDYDLVAVTFAAAWLAAEAAEGGFRPFEKAALAGVIALPLLSLTILNIMPLQIGCLLLWAALIVAARRALQPGAQAVGQFAQAC